MVTLGIPGDPLERVDPAEADIELVVPKMFDRLAEPVGDLRLACSADGPRSEDKSASEHDAGEELRDRAAYVVSQLKPSRRVRHITRGDDGKGNRVKEETHCEEAEESRENPSPLPGNAPSPLSLLGSERPLATLLLGVPMPQPVAGASNRLGDCIGRRGLNLSAQPSALALTELHLLHGGAER